MRSVSPPRLRVATRSSLARLGRWSRRRRLSTRGSTSHDFNDGAADVRYSDTDSLAGRVGGELAQLVGRCRVGRWTARRNRQLTVWGRADLWHEFLGDPTTEFSSATGFIPFTADLGENWATFGLGAAYQLDDRATSTATSITRPPSKTMPMPGRERSG